MKVPPSGPPHRSEPPNAADPEEPGRPFRVPLLWIAVVAILVVFVSGTNLATLYTDRLWFGEVGQPGVFSTLLESRVELFTTFAAAAGLLAGGNAWFAARRAPKPAGIRIPRSDGRGEDVFLFDRAGRPVAADSAGAAASTLETERRLIAILLTLATVAFAALAGFNAVGQADAFRRLHPSSFGIADPQFGNDIGLYVFTLPFVRYMQTWLLTVLFLVLVGVGVIYLVQQGARLGGGGGAAPSASTFDTFVPRPVRAHLSVVLALVFIAKAWGYWLDRYDLLYGSGLVPGAGYTDVHSRLPLLNILAAVALCAAIAALVNIWRRTLIVPAAAIAVWLAISGIGVVLPGTMQAYTVRPNEAQAEAPYLARGIAATRHAYAVDNVKIEGFAADPELTAADLARNRATIDNIRLWDYEPLLETYPQQQGLRQYYAFPDVDVDRYPIAAAGAGSLTAGSAAAADTQVLLAAREINPDGLDASAQTWPNLHLRYTHGFGIVMSSAGRITPEGLPTYLVRDIPVVTNSPNLALTQPRIYYGNGFGRGTYAVVNTRQPEFDCPNGADAGSPDRENRYDGRGGIPLTPVAKLAFAARFGDWTTLLLSSAVTSDSKLLFARRVADRVQRVAPFLMLDHDPYPVLTDGRIVWIQDAYTTTENYPYSAALDNGERRFNYVRNSVKATVDAYDGTVTLYAADEADPILQTYMRIFPGLIRPASEMPAELRAHRRFPEDLFAAQRRILADYHVTDPGVFYERADAWQVPASLSGVDGQNADASGDSQGLGTSAENQADAGSDLMAPYYVTLRLPDEPANEFALLTPFTQRQRENMSAMLAARCDGDHYGEEVLYRFPASRTVYGPEQVGKRIRSDGKVSPYLSLNDQKGSKVRFGSMLVVPVEKSLLYVEPLYVKADTGSDPAASIPELKQVVVAFDDRIAMEPTLDAALTDLFGGSAAAPPSETPAVAAGAGGTSGSTLAGLIDTAGSQYDQAQSDLRRGDFAAYGRDIGQLGVTLRQLRTTPGRAAPSHSSATH